MFLLSDIPTKRANFSCFEKKNHEDYSDEEPEGEDLLNFNDLNARVRQLTISERQIYEY